MTETTTPTTEDTMATRNTHRVVKSQRGGDGKWFRYDTAARFPSEASAREYAESFATSQRRAGVVGTKILVLTAGRSGEVVASYPV